MMQRAMAANKNGGGASKKAAWQWHQWRNGSVSAYR